MTRERASVGAVAAREGPRERVVAGDAHEGEVEAVRAVVEVLVPKCGTALHRHEAAAQEELRQAASAATNSKS